MPSSSGSLAPPTAGSSSSFAATSFVVPSSCICSFVVILGGPLCSMEVGWWRVARAELEWEVGSSVDQSSWGKYLRTASCTRQ